MGKKVAGILSTLIILGMAVAFGAYLLGVKDYISASNFKPTSEMDQLISSLNFTDKGDLIMRATWPELEDSATFNENCSSHDNEIYVLGCYDSKSDRLHLYNITSTDMDGIVESTAAHEMLHAAWNRLATWDQLKLEEELVKVYNNLPEDSDIRASMELYSEDDFYDELHSRIGTELAELPYMLETHYSHYFKNQDEIVSYYKKYHGKYKEMNAKLEEIEKQIEELNQTIDEETEKYKTWADEVNQKIEDFNNRVNDLNETDYNNQRGELVEEINKLDKFYEELNQKIEEYNRLIAEYNKNAIKQKDMLDSINSNSENI